ncbi:MAG: hypothetical protein NXI12_06825 [Alphaproteobacteria bacterium]|nr:hypothetical protein [Alphaproteobacteria bacterium]
MQRIAQRALASDTSKVRELLEEEIKQIGGGNDLIFFDDGCPTNTCSSPGTRTGCGPGMDRTTDWDS